MADVRNYIQINPVDTDKNKAVGVSLPYDGTAVFNSTYTTQEQMKSNILVMFPSSLKYFITHNISRKRNIFLTTTYEFK